MTDRDPRPRSGEEGYALLALLASSAILLAGLALSLPRMAMQSQRVKEERLVERGEQYMRAIKLYYREHNKYPEELDDLEDTDGVRYLRRRYTEPLGDTGEWRVIHMGTDGRFEDSLLYDLAEREPGRGTGLFGGSGRGLSDRPAGSTTPSQTAPVFPGVPGSGGFADPGAVSGPQPLVGPGRARVARESAAPDLAARNRYSQGFEFNASQAASPEAGGAGEVSGQPDYSRMLPSTVPMDENDPRRTAPYGAIQQPGSPGGASDPFGRSTDANQGIAQAPGMQVQAPGGTTRQTTGNQAGLAAGSGASEMINRLLTSPRPGGLAGPAGTQAGAVAAPVFERGIAGVASESEETGVKVYNGREPYNEWEFVFDYRKDAEAKGNPARAQPQVPGQQQSNQAGVGSRGRARR